MEDEIPFEVPDGWRWCKISDICNVVMGQSPSGENVSANFDEGMEFHQGKIYFTDRFLNISKVKTNQITKIAPKQSLLLCVRAPVGVINITERDICIGRGLCSLIPKFKIDSLFMFYWLQTLKTTFESKATGTTFKAISVDVVKNEIIPLPPLSEQKAIVAKIEEIFAQIDILENSKSDLQTTIKYAKSKILDLAIHGKLVPQDPNDEPASKLLDRIHSNCEFDEGKQGKRSEKILHNGRYEKLEDVPFDVPDGWAWCKLGEIAEIARGGSPRPIQDYITDDVNGLNWIKIGDTKEGDKYITSAKEKIKPEGLKKTRMVHVGDFLLTNSMSFGRPYILKIDGCIHDGWLVFANIANCIEKDYLFYAITSNYIYSVFSQKSMGSTVKNLKSDTVKEVFFPLPPLAEQKRIVAKIESLFSILDSINENLS